MYTIQQLASDLSSLGVRPGDTILMHSSYKSLGRLDGGAKEFFETFLHLLGPEGTLALPALSYGDVSKDRPVFDALHTPSCVGYLPEYFRTQVPGVVRSLHPTHSCSAAGKHAAFLTEGHENDETPVGPNSPFAKLPKLGGKILMLGCSPDHNTSMHGVEETAEPPYLLNREERVQFTLKDAQGVEHVRSMMCHNFVLNGHYCEQRYSRILPLLSDCEVSYGKVLDADCVLMDASAVWQKGREMLLKEPFYFVEGP